MHRPIWRDRIEARKNGLVRIVNASWKNYSLDVLKVDENGNALCRNLFYTTVGGYMVEFQDYGVQGWGKPIINIGNSLDYSFSSEKDIETVCAVYPKIKWTLQKAGKLTNDEVMKTVAIWKKNPKIELVFAAGFKKIALNEAFYKMNEKAQKDVIKVMMQYKDCEQAHYWSLADVKKMVKQNINGDQLEELKNFNSWRKIKFSWEEYQFLKDKKKEYIATYGDYKKMAKRAGHDFSEAYWYKPKNLKAMHDRVMLECANLDAVEFEKKNKDREKAYIKAVGKRKLAKIFEKDGWKVYIPDSIKDIKYQADVLHQCLISADYVQRVISKRCVLVFIRYKGRPVATAELLSGNKLGQFYGDERAKNIYASPKARQMFNSWKEAA